MPDRVPKLVEGLNIQPSSGDITQTIYHGAQLKFQEREAQRQSVQGLVNAFMTGAELIRRREKDSADNLAAQLTLDETNRANRAREKQARDSLQLREDVQAGKTGEGRFAQPGRQVLDASGKLVSTQAPGAPEPKVLSQPKAQTGLASAKKSIAEKMADIAEINQIFENTKDLVGGKSGIGARIGGLIHTARGAAGIDDRVRSFEGQSKVLRTKIVRALAGDRGNLSVSEQEAVESFTIQLNDTEGEREQKKKAINSIFGARIKALQNGLLSDQPLPNRGKLLGLTDREVNMDNLAEFARLSGQ